MNQAQVKQLLPLLIAFADGKQLEFRFNGGSWHPCYQSPDAWACGPNVECRIKPEPVVIKYQRYLALVGDEYMVLTQRQQEGTLPRGTYFVRWLDDDWKEVMV